jgi:hypothetical protein
MINPPDGQRELPVESVQRGACDRCLHLYRRAAGVALQSHMPRCWQMTKGPHTRLRQAWSTWMYAAAFHEVMVEADTLNLRLICAVCRHENRFAKHIGAVDNRSVAWVEVL